MAISANTTLFSALTRLGRSESVRLWLLVAIAATLPFAMLFNSFLIILLGAQWLLAGRFREKWQRLRQHPLALAWMAFYVLHLVGMFYTVDLGKGKSDVEAKLSFLVLPLMLGSMAPLARQHVRWITYAFVAACTAAALYCVGQAGLAYLRDGDSNHFFYHNLGGFIGIHAVYFGVYLSFCLFVLADFLMRHRGEGHSRARWGAGLLMLLLTTVIILLSSKMVIILLAVYLNLFLLLYAVRSRRRYVLGAVVVANVLLGAALFNLPFVRDRFRNAFTTDLSYIKQGEYDFYYTGVSLRIAIWKVCTDILREKRAWLWGVGTGDGQMLLDEKYRAYGFYTGNAAYNDTGVMGFNAHNQYMEFLLCVGLAGLAAFLALLVLSGRAAMQSGQYPLAALLVLLAVSCLTESMFCRQKGVVFFMLFYCLYAFHSGTRASLHPKVNGQAGPRANSPSAGGE